MEKVNEERILAGGISEEGEAKGSHALQTETNPTELDEKRGENFFRSFKSKEELVKAYTSLEREFTKKSQQLKGMSKEGQERNVDAEAERFLKKYPQARQFSAEISAVFQAEPDLISEDGALERAYIKVLTEGKKEEPREDFLTRALLDSELKERVVLDYLKRLPTNLPNLISGGSSPLTAPKRAVTLSEAGAEALQILKR